MATVTIFGASDDLIEIEGDLDEEFSAMNEDGMTLAFGDGTILDVVYDDFGVWRITRKIAGSASYMRDEDPGNDEDRYSDRVKLTGALGWVFAAEKPTLHKIDEPKPEPTS